MGGRGDVQGGWVQEDSCKARRIRLMLGVAKAPRRNRHGIPRPFRSIPGRIAVRVRAPSRLARLAPAAGGGGRGCRARGGAAPALFLNGALPPARGGLYCRVIAP